jgi:hypothetical protein
MITITKHKNFSNWFQVFSFGKMIDEFTRRADALELAQSIARNKELDQINVLGRIQQVKS